MKKLLLLNLSLLAVGLGLTTQTSAQSKAEIMGARLMVDAPTSINHTIKFTYSSSGTTPWGGAITNPIVHQEVVKAVDSQACSALTGTYANKWVLIYRGDCEFGQKAKIAQNAGAAGVIIWNHTPNSPLVNMGAGAQGSTVTIPVIFVSNEDGREMTNQLSSGQQLFVSLTRWGFGANNDLAIVSRSTVMPHAGAMPLYQFDGSDIPAYRAYNGAFVANLGVVDQTNLQLVSKGSFTPQGGSETVLYNDTIATALFQVSDSIIQLMDSSEYVLNPSGVGRYDFSYEVISDSVDATPSDNKETISMHITTNAYCKGAFDPVTQKPISNTQVAVVNTQSGAAVLSTVGPMFFFKKGGYVLDNSVFTAQNRDTTVKSLATGVQKYIDLYCFKWNDANSNNFMEATEMTLVSVAVKEFQPADSNNGKVHFVASWGDDLGKPKKVVTEDNTWYWFAANLGEVLSIGGDAGPNYYNRANAAKNFAKNKRYEFWAPRYAKEARVLRDNPGDTILAIPFGTTTANSTEIDSANYTFTDGVVNIAVYTSVFQDNVEKTTAPEDKLSVYPNPASDKATLKYNLVEKAGLVHFKVVDAFGRNVFVEDRTNVQNGEYTVNTSSLASGTYYFVMISGERAMTKAFTVVNK